MKKECVPSGAHFLRWFHKTRTLDESADIMDFLIVAIFVLDFLPVTVFI
ncbi:hypothetical protein [Peribacillus sp. V2I11]|nr:hypothetical protein [Peribacillus sp. V2I11]MDQ0880721.1 hypothetical protein [Peribacillus sp. V2I11]